MALPTFSMVNDISKKAWTQIALLQEQFFQDQKGAVLGCVSLHTVW